MTASEENAEQINKCIVCGRLLRIGGDWYRIEVQYAKTPQKKDVWYAHYACLRVAKSGDGCAIELEYLRHPA